MSLDVNPYDTFTNIKNLIAKKEGTPADQIRLIYSGKIVDDGNSPSYYNMQRESTIHMVRRLGPPRPPTELVTDTSATKSYEFWEAKAKAGDFDQDLHIVDPASHYHLLQQLERQIVMRSEYCQSHGNYDVNKHTDTDFASQFAASPQDLPIPLRGKFEANWPKWKVSITM